VKTTHSSILITGASQRVGAAIAKRLAGANNIILHYHQSMDAAEALAAELRAKGVKVTPWQQDLRANNLTESFRKLISDVGAIDVLINNAAVFYPDRDRAGEITSEFYDEVMRVNTWAPLCLMQEMARALPDGAAGNIINILDQRVLNISHAFPVYTASKSALWALTKNMAAVLAPHIRVNAIAPGHVLPSVGESEDIFRARQAKTPLGIGPTPEDIAATVEMILNSPSMTGACVPLDGGEHLVPK